MSRIKESEKDQAGELRTRVDRQKAKSSLPKRSEIHQNKKKKSKVKIKFPMIKLLSLFFILLPIGFYSLYTYLQDRPEKDAKSSEVVNFIDGEETVEESVPTTATAGDVKEKEEEEKDSAKLKEEKREAEKAAEEKAKKEAEAKADAEAKAKQEAELKAKKEAEAKAKQEAEARAKQEAEAKAKQEAEDKKVSDGAASQSDSDNYKVVYHTVQGEETLFRIAMNYYKSQEGIALIQEWNGLNGNEISKGQVLKIPMKK